MQTSRGTAPVGDVELFYEELGDPAHPAVLLIMGVGAQLPMWPDGFCERLVERGLRVIRYDHRDIGLSTKLHGQRATGRIVPRVMRYMVGRTSSVPYTLVDMADDAKGLLDHLGIERAHVVGASMGGMIAQVFAARFAERTRSLGIIFASNNHAFLPPPAPRALLARLSLSQKVALLTGADSWRIPGCPALPRALNILPASSHGGTQLPTAAGVAWAAKMQKKPTVALALMDASEVDAEDFHAGVNFAAVFRLPVSTVGTPGSDTTATTHTS